MRASASRNRALTRANFDDDIVFGRMYRTDDGIDDARVGQEMLPESFACSMPGHHFDAMSCASLTAAMQAPGIGFAGAGDIECRTVIDGGPE